jgi:hypothetical protein
MTQEDTLRMAHEAGWKDLPVERLAFSKFDLTCFVAIVASAEREKVAHWMRNCGYATGHGDTIEDLLDHLGTQIAERLLMEREVCAKVAEQWGQDIRVESWDLAGKDCAAAIRARGDT